MRIFAEGVNSGIARSSIPAIARHLVYIYCDPTFLPILIVNSLRCAEVPLRNCSLTHSLQLQLRSGPSQKYFFCLNLSENFTQRKILNLVHFGS